jgi:hypothetical protein
MRKDPPPIDAGEPEEHRDRVYNLGALAQSYAPRGLADVLNLSPEGRARARANWLAQPRWQRVALFVIIAMELACAGVLVWGVAQGRASIVLAGAGGLVAILIGTTVLSIVLGVRQTLTRR